MNAKQSQWVKLLLTAAGTLVASLTAAQADGLTQADLVASVVAAVGSLVGGLTKAPKDARDYEARTRATDQ